MKSRIALATLCAGLGACGGGGGDEPTGVALSAANYLVAAREAIAPVSFLTETSSLIIGVKVSGANTLFKFSTAQLPKVSGWFSSAGAQVSGVTQTEIEYCENGQPPGTDGTLSITTDDVNGNDQADPGDSITIFATNCLFDGAILNGEMRLVVESFTGVVDVPPYSFAAGFTFNNFDVQYGSVTERGNGSFSLNVDVPSIVQRLISMHVPSLAMSLTEGATTHTKTLSGYNIAESFDTGTTTVSVSGTVNTSLLQSNALTTSTVSPFTLFGDGEPTLGQVLISAAMGGKIRLTALSTGGALIELDANGDGTYETVNTVPWDELI